jgi:hypothetical protein
MNPENNSLPQTPVQPQPENIPPATEQPIATPMQTEVPPIEEPASEPASSLRQIRTYQGDIAGAIENQNESLFSMQQAERARQGIPQDPSAEQTEGKGNKLKAAAMLLGSFLLVGAGVVGGWYSYVEFGKKTALPEIQTSPNQLISSAKSATLDASTMNRSSLINSVAEESAKAGLPPGEVLFINLLDSEAIAEAPAKPTSAQKLMAILEARAPGNLVRAMSSTFMLGALERVKAPAPEPIATTTAATTTETATPIPDLSSATSTATSTPQAPAPRLADESIFIIIKLESFENAFAGMLAWEAKMLEDLGPLFSTRELAANTPSDTAFEDVTERNKDARVLRNPEGEVVLLYSFFDNNTLIITDSEETLRVILNRLTNELLSR